MARPVLTPEVHALVEALHESLALPQAAHGAGDERRSLLSLRAADVVGVLEALTDGSVTLEAAVGVLREGLAETPVTYEVADEGGDR